MTGQFIAYYTIDGDEAVPCATGSTHDDAQALAITRTLSCAIVDGGIAVQRRDDISADVFAKLGDTLDAHFAKRGVK